MNVETLIERLNQYGDNEAVISNGRIIRYSEIVADFDAWRQFLEKNRIPPGAVVSFNGDYTREGICLFLSLAANRNILVPLSRDSKPHNAEFCEAAMTEFEISLPPGVMPETAQVHRKGRRALHTLYDRLRSQSVSGLVLFSSGSTGKSKGIVHDFTRLLKKFVNPRRPYRMLIFLLLDHIGGVNSLLYILANGGTLIVPDDRNPATVCQTIQQWRAELLPTSPTFLNLMLLSGAYSQYDLNSLSLITYGTEPMPQSTLNRLAQILPGVTLQQTYGMSEVGILRSKSRGSNSLWVKIGGEDYRLKVVEGRLWIKSKAAMLGYLNAPDPFDADGFLDTGDLVEQDGEWFRILGRESELINVGGEKVFPAEVESVLLEMDDVEDAVVFGQSHAITGHIVAAKIKLKYSEPARDFKVRMRRFCGSRLQRFKIPSKIYFTENPVFKERYKRMRRQM
jgi:long-chain acyl-CoA synthetase